VCHDVQAWTRDTTLNIYCNDLSAATDRLPIRLQTTVLSHLIGQELANAWAGLLVKRSYRTPDGTAVQYAVGQPMGAKSSFPMLALTHHVIIRECAARVGTHNFKHYRVVGDDSVISQANVNAEYRGFMKQWGVTISESKSYASPACAKPIAEFCKRVYVLGDELTSLPVKLLVKTSREGKLAPQLQDHLQTHGVFTKDQRIHLFLAGILSKGALQDALIMNSMPGEVTGLRFPVTPNAAKLQRNQWFPDVSVEDDDIVQAYTYIAVVEQLKRLDNLVQTTALIAAALGSKAIGPDMVDSYANTMAPGKPGEEIKKIAAALPTISQTHPIVRAGADEVARITQLLFRLHSSDVAIQKKARSHLLDQFRNSLIELWSDARSARAQADRTLFMRTLAVLERVLTAPEGERFIQFQVMLQTVQRLWTVRWDRGSPVAINAVRSRVSASALSAEKNLASAADDIQLSG
jgi:hypothetical protein